MRTLRSLERSNSDRSAIVSSAQHAYVAAYITKMKRVRLAQILILIVFLGVWELNTRIGIIDPFVFSSPSRVIQCIYTMTVDGSLFQHIGITLLETFLSFAFPSSSK